MTDQDFRNNTGKEQIPHRCAACHSIHDKRDTRIGIVMLTTAATVAGADPEIAP